MTWLKWSSHEIPPKNPIPSIHSFYWAGIVGGVTSCVNPIATNHAHSCDHSTRPTVRKIIFARISVTLVSQASQQNRAMLAADTRSHRCNFPAQLSVCSFPAITIPACHRSMHFLFLLSLCSRLLAIAAYVALITLEGSNGSCGSGRNSQST